eukprot:TRINITY_DN3591_c0_g1_i4.p1 TRINITY_DN3591_c0_g1~~TRINITY_DN3591_c0_g1_i4.p1  ORF type:complete len:328 (-),score=74.99 TRINITY_DN3591_c0_g1_i4:199-1182(-)
MNVSVVDWDILERIWDHAFRKCLSIDPSEHPLLVTEPTYNTAQQREKVTEIAFEKFKPPGFFISKEATLSCYASGRATSLVIDSGFSKTVVSAVHDGYVLQNSIMKSNIAGNYISRALYRSLVEKYQMVVRPPYSYTKKKGNNNSRNSVLILNRPATPSFDDYQIMQIVDDMKKTVCHVSERPWDPLQPVKKMEYEFPDRLVCSIDAETVSLTESLFRDSTEGSIGQMVSGCISHCDVDLHKELYGGVIVTGGTSLFPGFVERVQKSIHPPNIFKLKVIAPMESIERRFSSWIGGSILGSLGSMHAMWISKSEYEEYGTNMVERKCP